MARSKQSRTPRPAFGGYKISFAGQQRTLEQVFGAEPIPPSAMTKKLWDHVKKHDLSRRG